MDNSKKRLISFIVITALLALYFIWGLINKGYLSFTGEFPFSVEIVGETTIQCDIDPCKIKLHSGEKSIIIQKTGFFDLVELANVKIFRTTELSAVFNFAPTIKEISEIPFISDIKKYSLVDDGAGQKLINSNDTTQKNLAYFPKPLSEAKIFGNQSSVLINTTSTTYHLNLSTNEKLLISDLPTISYGAFSRFGDYFAFSSPNFSELWILNKNNETQKLNINFSNTEFSWSAFNKLFYLTPSTEGYAIGSYNPVDDQYLEIKNFSEIKTKPDSFLVSANEKFAYFTSEGKSYQIQLK